MKKVSEKKKQSLLEEKISILIPQMALPTIIAQLITIFYNLVDTYFVSTLGTNATAAVGVNSSLERTITLIGSLIGSGACSYIARLLGGKKEEDADRVLSTSLFSGIFLGIVTLFLGKIWMEPMVYFLGATTECAQYSVQYATYVLYAAPFMVGSLILNMCLRSEGSATYAMIGIGFGGILNCVLDPIFIYGMGLGVAGASMATAISKAVSFGILLYPYLKKKCSVHIALKKIKFVWNDMIEVVKIGSTAFFRTVFQIMASITINRVAGEFSTSALAALSVANRVMEFPFAIILGFGMGYQPVVGFNWGAKRMDRVRESLKFATKVAVIGAIIVGGILFITAKPIVQIFNSEADAEVLQLGIFCIRLQCLVLVIHSWQTIVNMFYAGIGNAKCALLLSTSRQGYCFIPAAIILPKIIGITGVAASQAAADMLSLIVVIPLAVRAYHLIDREEELQTAAIVDAGYEVKGIE